MNHWVETAIQYLTKSLHPVPQKLNEIDWKNDLSDKTEIIADTIEAGLIKASDPENASKKFASYFPFWA